MVLKYYRRKRLHKNIPNINEEKKPNPDVPSHLLGCDFTPMRSKYVSGFGMTLYMGWKVDSGVIVSKIHAK